ncbi:MAG TPA: hypothetical protein DHW82_12325 [Spirochaetia bacterium]|nr:MAG: hypothetical protein A2Y41_02825 [Spirochaetes bacterium GWB1_36_13]HCL57777.1 hypothetical protein [Spirochaetia bacterium]
MKKIFFVLGLILLVHSALFADERSDFVEAVKKGDYEKVSEMVDRGVKLDFRDSEGKTILHIAAESGHYKVTGVLVRKKNLFIPTDRFISALPVAGLVALIFIVLAFLFGILYSHKLAGPIYRIEKTILQLINGNRDFKVKLRKGDEFLKLADTVNRLIDYMDKNRDLLERVKKNLDEFEKSPNFKAIDSIKKEIEGHLEELV